MTVNVYDTTWVNHAPVGTSSTVQTNEDTDYTFTPSNFGFTDPNDSPANNFLAVKVTSLPTFGVVRDYGRNLQAGDIVSIANVNAGLVTYSPEPEASGSSYVSFGFKVMDDGGTANSGSNLDSTARTMTIDVAAVNDVPLNLVAGSQTTGKNTNLVFSTGNGNLISIADVDAGSSTVQVALTATNGTLTLSGTSGLSFSFSDGNGIRHCCRIWICCRLASADEERDGCQGRLAWFSFRFTRFICGGCGGRNETNALRHASLSPPLRRTWDISEKPTLMPQGLTAAIKDSTYASAGAQVGAWRVSTSTQRRR